MTDSIFSCTIQLQVERIHGNRNAFGPLWDELLDLLRNTENKTHMRGMRVRTTKTPVLRTLRHKALCPGQTRWDLHDVPHHALCTPETSGCPIPLEIRHEHDREPHFYQRGRVASLERTGAPQVAVPNLWQPVVRPQVDVPLLR